MVQRVDCFRYCADKLSEIKSKKLIVYTPYHARAAFHQIAYISRTYDANRYLQALHSELGGELWINDILSRKDGALKGKLPFPLNCCEFDHTRVWDAMASARNRERRFFKLTSVFGFSCTTLTESDHASKAEGMSDISPMGNPFILHTINKSLCQISACYEEIDVRLRQPDLTQTEMEKIVEEWELKFDSEMERLPDPKTMSTEAKLFLGGVAAWPVRYHHTDVAD
ncbi:uncharacterized protein LY89DRAFT_229773 [Mollisia scopiformis]|uniref:Uncharacterized protein n=1 Tax=Mollisia scopiformis TaxID=149040 RepID=A0A194WVS3_MOLSC|nr:uncharacterized protein LY89DRAFT_229773 [Mollisia scopiformis]KUJ11687.1 hypothetical protein LY89DRAFT_229773 [Mollisia scopiformis]